MIAVSARPPVNPRKTQTVRALGTIDIAELRAAALATSPAAWAAEDAGKPNRFAALAGAQHIVFRFIDDPRDWRRSHDRPAWATWRGLLEPVLAAATSSYGYREVRYPRIMLAKLPAGAAIAPHVDANPAARWPHKVHVPLTTNAAVLSHFGGATRHLAAGEAIEVNNLAPHWVRNEGATDRIHLIFECYDAAQPAAGGTDR